MDNMYSCPCGKLSARPRIKFILCTMVHLYCRFLPMYRLFIDGLQFCRQLGVTYVILLSEQIAPCHAVFSVHSCYAPWPPPPSHSSG